MDRIPRDIDRQMASAKIMAEAKAQEYGAHIVSGDQLRAAEARNAAVAYFESHLDLMERCVKRALRQ